MNAKLTLIILFIASTCGHAQSSSDFTTNGKFTFSELLNLPDSADISPGQISKNGETFYLGLTQSAPAGTFEIDEDGNDAEYSDIFSYTLATKKTTELHVIPMQDSLQFFQCSLSADEKTIVFVINPYGGWTYNDLGIADKNQNGTYTYRYLSELNTPEVSDAYPWLSADGLRLYYINDTRIFFTQRKNRSAQFDAPQPLAYNGDVQLPILSCWLTPDEKNMYILSDNKIYKAIRKKTSKPFLLPALYTDEFTKLGFIASLSFSPNMKNLYLYVSDENNAIAHYIKK